MNITIVGTGYVGLTTGVCLAELGHAVTCLDIDEEKIRALSRGTCVIYENGLEPLLKKNLTCESLAFTTDVVRAMKHADVVFFAVATPEGAYGKADLSMLLAAAKQCAREARNGVIFINKSTAPPGTVAQINSAVAAVAPELSFAVASNPEFMSEGSAVKDFLHPDRIVIGTDNPETEARLKSLYAAITKDGHDHPIVCTTIASAELIKYASNSFLALKISFINEIADFAERVGADVVEIARGMGHDKRIGSHFLRAGIGYGGSCFGKDVKALAQSGEAAGFEFKIIKALSTVNDLRYRIILNKLANHYPDISEKQIGILGLAYKPDTDDVRDAPSLRIVHELLARHAHIKVFDPVACPSFQRLCPDATHITFAESARDCLSGCDAAIILTEWKEFSLLPFREIKNEMRAPLIIDGRNMLSRKDMERHGFQYEGIGT